MAEELDEETDVIFADDDGPPERITWQYEKLLATTEGQAWAASVESDHAYVNDAFDAFNTLPEDILTRVWESVDNEVWEEAGEALEDLGMWLENATMGGDSMESYWDEWNEDPARTSWAPWSRSEPSVTAVCQPTSDWPSTWRVTSRICPRA